MTSALSLQATYRNHGEAYLLDGVGVEDVHHAPTRLRRCQSQRCFFGAEIRFGVARQVSGVERSSCSRNMSCDSTSIPNRKDQLGIVRTDHGTKSPHICLLRSHWHLWRLPPAPLSQYGFSRNLCCKSRWGSIMITYFQVPEKEVSSTVARPKSPRTSDG